MANMSYCRFENTAQDLANCLEAMRDMTKEDGVWMEDDGEGGSMKLGDYEQPAVERMAKRCEEFLEMYADRT